MKWYTKPGDNDGIILATEVSLSRNIKGYAFPAKLSYEKKAEITAKVNAALKELDEYKFAYIDMSKLTRTQAISLAERSIISPDFTARIPGSALAITDDEDIRIMICEEDHINIKAVSTGFCTDKVYKTADSIDTYLDNKLGFAFDEKLGYLTRNPADIGTAMKASVILHLPALTRKGQISRLASTVSKLGLSIRAAYSSGSTPLGDIYKLSNQITLGISEESALTNLRSIALQLVEQEKTAAPELIKTPSAEDGIFRALGILKYARQLNSKEFMDLLSLLRFGSTNGKIDISTSTLNELLYNMLPATIAAGREQEKTDMSDDAIRAENVRTALAGIN